MRIGVIGLGWIGMGVARLALKAGHEVVGYDVATFEADALPGGMQMVSSPGAAADGSDCVLVAVYDDAQVMSVLNGDDGVLASAKPGHVAVILSTVTLDTIRQADADAKRVGVSILDCGVSGGHNLAKGHGLALAVGGDPDAVERIRPALESFGEPVGYMGPSGCGMAAKLARNLMHYCSALVDREAALLAARAGVDVNSFVTFVKNAELLGGGHMEYVAPGPDDGLQSPGLPSTRYAYKDLGAALDVARQLSLELPTATLAHGIFAAKAKAEA